MTGAERAWKEGRRAGLLEAAALVEGIDLGAGADLGRKVVEAQERLRALAGPVQVGLNGGEESREGDELNQRAWICIIAHLQAREKFYKEERGAYHPPTTAALAEMKKEIRAALIRHHETNGDREMWRKESAVLAAGIGILYSAPHNGEMEKERHAAARSREPNRVTIGGGWLPKLYLELWRPWKLQKGKPDPVPGFAELCFERRRGDGL